MVVLEGGIQISGIKRLDQAEFSNDCRKQLFVSSVRSAAAGPPLDEHAAGFATHFHKNGQRYFPEVAPRVVETCKGKAAALARTRLEFGLETLF